MDEQSTNDWGAPILYFPLYCKSEETALPNTWSKPTSWVSALGSQSAEAEPDVWSCHCGRLCFPDGHRGLSHPHVLAQYELATPLTQGSWCLLNLYSVWVNSVTGLSNVVYWKWWCSNCRHSPDLTWPGRICSLPPWHQPPGEKLKH